MALPEDLVDCRVEHGDVSVDVQAVLSGGAPDGAKPSLPGGIALDERDLLFEDRIGPFEFFRERGVEITDRLEALDSADGLAGLDGVARLDVEAHLHRFTQHPDRELGEADPPEIAFFFPKPVMARRIEAVPAEARGEPGPLVMDVLGLHQTPAWIQRRRPAIRSLLYGPGPPPPAVFPNIAAIP